MQVPGDRPASPSLPSLPCLSCGPPSVPGSAWVLLPLWNQSPTVFSSVSFCPGKSQFAELCAYVDGNVEKYFNHSSNLCL